MVAASLGIRTGENFLTSAAGNRTAMSAAELEVAKQSRTRGEAKQASGREVC